MKFFIFLMLAVFANSIFANDCLELTKCIETVSKLTSKKYLYDAKEIKGTLQASSNLEINAANADTLFTYILDMNGYSRVPTAEKDTYTVISSRDIRYQAVPVIKVDFENPPKLTPNSDYYMMAYKFKHFKDGQLRMSANRIRPFMSRYARIIEEGDVAYVQEMASKLVMIHEMIKNTDREFSKAEIKEMKEKRESFEKRRFIEEAKIEKEVKKS